MRYIPAFLCLFVFSPFSWPQLPAHYKSGLTGAQNLAAIGKLNPNAPGGLSFDDRYEGVKGSPYLFDTLMTSFLRIKGQNEFMNIETNINAYENSLLYRNPSTGRLYEIAAHNISDLVVISNNEELYFRSTEGLSFEKPMKEPLLCQVLNSGKAQFIRIPRKVFIKADYRGAYTADRRYDEFRTEYRYFLSGPDNICYQVNLTKKSIEKVYPDKKELIRNFDESSFSGTKEEMILAILRSMVP